MAQGLLAARIALKEQLLRPVVQNAVVALLPLCKVKAGQVVGVRRRRHGEVGRPQLQIGAGGGAGAACLGTTGLPVGIRCCHVAGGREDAAGHIVAGLRAAFRVAFDDELCVGLLDGRDAHRKQGRQAAQRGQFFAVLQLAALNCTLQIFV